MSAQSWVIMQNSAYSHPLLECLGLKLHYFSGGGGILQVT